MSNRVNPLKIWGINSLIKRFATIVLLSAIGNILLAYGTNQEITGFRSAYGPSGNLLVSAPVLVWKVWPGPGCEVTSIKMVIDQQKVDAHYDSSTRLLTYNPSNPLSPGEHHVSCVATISNLLKMRQSWDFHIANSNSTELPAPSPSLNILIESVNQCRGLIGLGPVSPNSKLTAAAEGHSKYLAAAHSYGHYEMENLPSFVGQSMSDRLNAFGWIFGGYEDVGYEPARTPNQTILALYNAPYHRIPFMQPGNIEVGVGASNHRTTIEFSFSNKSGIVVSPAKDETQIPQTWNAVESPNPLRFYNVDGTVGYPIVIAGFGKADKIRDVDFTLFDSDGNRIPCFLNTPSNDSHLDSQAIAIPKRPLENGTYQAKAIISFADGSTDTKIWSYTVGS